MVKKLVFIFVVAVLLTACKEEIANEQENNKQPIVESETQQEEETTLKEPEIYTATISAIGDILIHNSVYEDAYIGNQQYDFTKMFQHVKPYFETADIAVANSESIIGGQEIGLSSYPAFNSPYEVGDALKDLGINVVTMANNHTLDRGERAILNATNYWNELGILYVGAATSLEESEEIKTLTSNHIVFSFLGYTYGTNGLVPPKGKEYLVNYIDDEKIQQDIERAKEISDVVVVNLHWGTEYQRHFNLEQERIAKLVADAGAHIILAHHPHVLQPAKWYEGKNGNQTFVIYSLGNFLSAQDKLYRQIGAILQLDVKKTVVYDMTGHPVTSIEIENPQLLPTYVKFQNWRNYEILPFYRLTNEDLANADGIYEELKVHMSQYMPELQFIEREAEF